MDEISTIRKMRKAIRKFVAKIYLILVEPEKREAVKDELHEIEIYQYPSCYENICKLVNRPFKPKRF